MAATWLGDVRGRSSFQEALGGMTAMAGMFQSLQAAKQQQAVLAVQLEGQRIQNERLALGLEQDKQFAPLREKAMVTELAGLEARTAGTIADTAMKSEQLSEFRETKPLRRQAMELDLRNAEDQNRYAFNQDMRAGRQSQRENELAISNINNANLQQKALQKAMEQAEVATRNAPAVMAEFSRMMRADVPEEEHVKFGELMAGQAVGQIAGILGTLKQTGEQNSMMERQLLQGNQQLERQAMSEAMNLLRSGDPRQIGAAEALAIDYPKVGTVVNAYKAGDEAMRAQVAQLVEEGDMEGAAGLVALMTGQKIGTKTSQEFDFNDANQPIKTVTKPDTAGLEAQARAVSRTHNGRGRPAQEYAAAARAKLPPRPVDAPVRDKMPVAGQTPAGWYKDKAGTLFYWNGKEVVE